MLLIKWAKRKGFSISITIHDFQTHIGESSHLIEYIQRWCIKNADEVIFLTEFVKNQAIKSGLNKQGFKVNAHPLLASGVVNKLPHNPHPRILFLGRNVEYKGIDLLLEACNGLDIGGLTLAGKNIEATQPSIKNLKILNTYLSEKAIGELLLKHEILILPYKEASQSGVICLGIYAEMAMIITKVGGMPEQLNSEAAVWVFPEVKDIREGIIRLMNDKSKYLSVKENIKIQKYT